MKKIFFVFAAFAALAVTACNKDNGTAEEPANQNTITYGGVTYKTVTFSNGQTWMAEPLRYIPDGKAVSDRPDSTGICYPQGFTDVKAWRDTTFKADTVYSIAWKHSETFAALKDEASVKAAGLLYSWDVIFGEPVTATNWNTFEGKQGICPDGWHVPTKDEWKAVVGTVSGETTDKTALYYDAAYDGAIVNKLEADGFKFGFTGMIANKVYTKTNVISSAMSDVKDYIGNPAMTYIASSTGKAPASGKDATQMYSVFSTFSAGTYDKATKTSPDMGKYPKGRLTGGYANFAGGFVQVRCIKNK